MSEQRAEPDTTNTEDETYEPPEVSDFGALAELTRGGGPAALSDLAAFNNQTAMSGGS